MASKIFNDPIYKQTELRPMCVKIVDTRQFQRLRHLKQLGMKSYVYPGANHTRFEHSIGVCHLAGKIGRQLQQIHGKDMISNQEVARVEIAGLCHDLGHGPMSHLFERVYEKVYEQSTKKKMHHEEKSREMLELLIKENKLGYALENAAGSDALVLIQDIIHLFPDLSKLSDNQASNVTEQRKKHYLYQIVANDDNGIDVDRWDYLARDALYLGSSNYFRYDRIVPHMRICDCVKEERTHKGIAYRDKELKKHLVSRGHSSRAVHVAIQKVKSLPRSLVLAKKVKDELLIMFRTRFNLHCKACEHRVGQAVGCMVGDAFKEAWRVKFINVPGKSEGKFNLEEASEDIEVYQYLDDRILKVIQNSPDEELQKAKDLLDRIDNRDIYTCVGQFEIEENDSDDLKKKNKVIEDLEKAGFPLIEQTADYHYGKKELSPFDKTYFYTKNDDKNARPAQANELPLDLPTKWRYRYHRFYVTMPNMEEEDKNEAKRLVEKTLEEYKGSYPTTPQRLSNPTGSGPSRSAPTKKGRKRQANSEAVDGAKKRFDFK